MIRKTIGVVSLVLTLALSAACADTANTEAAAEEGSRIVIGETEERLTEEQSGDESLLRILQFNIQTENGNKTPFSVRSEMYRKLLEELEPDVVGMQEVTVAWRKWLDESVFGDAYAGVGEHRTARGEANPIYYRRDKFELLDSGTIWLSDTPDVPGSVYEGSNCPRICTWVRLRNRTTGREFAHINTHLDNKGKNDAETANGIRLAQMAVIVRLAQKFAGMPLFLTGDFNSARTAEDGGTCELIRMVTGEVPVPGEDGSECTLALADSRLDAPVTADRYHTATMTKFYDENTGKMLKPGREPIDYIFYDPQAFEALTYEAFLITQDGAWISDHLPVFATFQIK